DTWIPDPSDSALNSPARCNALKQNGEIPREDRKHRPRCECVGASEDTWIPDPSDSALNSPARCNALKQNGEIPREDRKHRPRCECVGASGCSSGFRRDAAASTDEV
ncbi:uncharacterized, partial [Tachysurus ichikawai]